MIFALLVAIAAAFAVGAAGLSFAHLRRVAAVAAFDARSLATSLKRLPPAERIEALARRGGDRWEGRLAGDLLAAEDASARLAIVNDALADVDGELRASAGWPSAAVRIDAFGALLLCAIAVLAHRLDAVLPIVGVAGAGLVGTIECGRRARKLASEKRAAVDALVDAVASPFLGDATPPPTRRRGRSRRS
jgi:hypothetical protein